MSFISYAQNFEDVILHRVFRNVKDGVYIDVGANDPIVDSVTKSLYDSGWHGINIEPVAEWHERLQEDRPRDINLQIAAGNSEGEVDFYEVVGTGLSTMDKSIAVRHAQESCYEVKSYKVPIDTLSNICKQHTSPTIHFLKIDVEGAEKAVLQGLDFTKIRPWICIVESTLPNLTIEQHADWEPILLAADYEFVYFDGLNRFYVAKEHQELKNNLGIPPNIFDDFFLSGLSNGSIHYQIAQIKGSLTEAYEQQKVLEATQRETEQQQKQLGSRIENALSNTILQDEVLRDKDKMLLQVISDLTEKQKQAAELEIQTHKLRMESTRLQEMLQEKETKLHSVISNLEENQNLLRSNESKLIEVTTSFKETTKRLTDRESELKTINTGLTKTKKLLSDRENELQASGIAYEELKFVIEDLQKHAEVVKGNLISRDWLLRDTSAALEEYKDSNQQLKSQLNVATQQVFQLRDELEISTEQNSHLQQKNSHLQHEAERLDTGLRDVYNSRSWRTTLPLRKLWKPFEKTQHVAELEPHNEEIETTLEAHAHNSPPPAKGVANIEKLSTTEIRNRIKTELVNNNKDKIP